MSTTTELLLGDAGPGTEIDLSQLAPRRRLFRELLQSRKGLFGAIVVAIVVFLCAAASLVAPHGANEINFELANVGPSWAHPFGNDELGRDLFSRMIYATRLSFVFAVVVVAISVVIGTALGSCAGYLGGFLDQVIMRTTDFLFVFPGLVLILLLFMIFGQGLVSILLAFIATSWLGYARIVRAETLKLRELDFVHASRAIGSSSRRILFRHVVPNIGHTLLVLAMLDIGGVLLAEAAIQYLGLGFSPDTPTWGGIIAEGQGFLQQDPWIMLIPGAVLMVTVIAINLFGDWLRDVLDPSLRIQ
jgi:ABC-type dipeptide/oligopeptide/nickel transport system permease subunit